MSQLADALERTAHFLLDRKIGCALVGGLAVSARVEPRFTRDIDLAVAVLDDDQAERHVAELTRAGYVLATAIDQTATGRLAAVRLEAPGEGAVLIDLLFASSGVEPEVVEGAESLEVFPGWRLPVASVGDLIALKLLARSPERPQDEVDLANLMHVATATDMTRAHATVELIADRGYARGRDLANGLRELQRP